MSVEVYHSYPLPANVGMWNPASRDRSRILSSSKPALSTVEGGKPQVTSGVVGLVGTCG